MTDCWPRSLACLLAPALGIAWSSSAWAQLVAYEGFEGYSGNAQLESDGTSVEGTGRNGGMGWGGAYDVFNAIKPKVKIEDRSSGPGPVNYANGEILIPGGNRALRFWDNANAPDSYAVRRAMGTVFQAAAGESLWFSILFRTAAGGASPQGDQDLFQIGFDDNANPDLGNPRVSIGSNTLSTTDFPSACHFFARSTTDPSASEFHESLPIAAATTYLLVGQIQATSGAYNTVNLFVNPSGFDSPGPPSASITAPSGLSSLSHAFIRTAYLDHQDAYVLDEWRIGRDYASVAGSLQGLLLLLPAASVGGDSTLRWPARMPGVLLESSSTLAADSWEEVAGPFAGAAGYWNLTLPVPPGSPRRFFRLRR